MDYVMSCGLATQTVRSKMI